MANELKFTVVFDTKTGEASIQGLTSKLRGVGDVAKETGGSVGSSFANMATGLNQALELAGKLSNLLVTPLKSAGQFEAYETSLKVMLGTTEKAKARLEELVEFAKITPFELPQVVEAANKLQAIGKYSKENMTMLGDLAAAAGKPYEQVLSAYSKLATGQKGIAVDMFRDLLITTDDWQKATGKGQKATGELEASATEMLASLDKIVKSKNFSGMMDQQSKTMLGQWSNFQDAIGQTMTELGNQLMPIAKELLSTISPIFSFLKENMTSLITVAGYASAAFVAYKATILLTSGAVSGLIPAIKAMSVALMANPAALMVGGVVALAGAYLMLKDAMTETTEEKVAGNKAELEGLKTKQETVKTVISEKENNIKLLNEYKSLASEKKKTADQTKRMSDLNNILGEKYPGLIKSGTDYRQNLIGIESQLTKTKNEAYGLSQEYQNLSKVQKQIMIKLAESQMEDTLQKAYDIKGGVQNSAFMSKFYQALWDTKSIGDVDTKTLKALENADQAITDGIYKLTEKSEVYSAIKAMAAQRKNQLNIWSSSNVDIAKAPDDKKPPDKKKSEKTAAELLADDLKRLKAEYEAARIDGDKYSKGLDEIQSKIEAYYKKTSDKEEKEKLNASTKSINDEREKLEREHWEKLIKVHETGKENLEIIYQDGLISTKEYYDRLKELESNFLDSELTVLFEKYKKKESLSKDEDAFLKSYLKSKSDFLKEIMELSSKSEKIKMSDLSTLLNLNSENFEKGKLPFEDYKKFLSDSLLGITGILSQPQYSDIFQRLQSKNLSTEFLNSEIERLKRAKDPLAEALSDITKTYESFSKENEKIQEDTADTQAFYNDVMVRGIEALSEGIGSALGSGFSKEGFKKMSQNLFEGFKDILNLSLTFLEKQYLLGEAKSFIDAIFNPVQGTADLGFLIAGEVAIQAARAAIDSWTPKFALGGGVTGPTYLLAGEANKKEYIISPEQMQKEVQDLMKNEMRYFYNIGNSKTTIDVNIAPVELRQRGRDMVGVIKKQEKFNSLTQF